MKFESWEYTKQFMDEKTLKIEEEEGDLKMYSYFSTLRWRNCTSIVYKDFLLREYEDDIPYDDWNMAVDMFTILKIEHGESDKTFQKTSGDYILK